MTPKSQVRLCAILILMSGHSHWSTIKHKKEAKDQQKGKAFGKVSAEIMLAISQGNNITDPEKNVRLRAAISKAKEVNMPKENITRLINRLEAKSQSLVEVVYEALGPEDITFLIKTATDNPRRTQTDIKIVLDKNNGKLVSKNAVMYNYDLLAMFVIEDQPEEVVLKLIEAIEALNFEREGNCYYVYVDYSRFAEAWAKAKEMGLDKAPELVYKAKQSIEVSGTLLDKAVSIANKLEEIEEVQTVFTNIK